MEKASKKRKIIDILKEDKLDDYQWLIPNNDIGIFMQKRINTALIGFVISLLGFMAAFYGLNYLGYKISPLLSILFALMTSYICFKWKFWSLKSAFKKRKEDVYKSFPLWVSTLEILIITNNIPNTFKKSIETCPECFRGELIEFVKKIEVDPENKEYYKNFLRKYKIEDVSEIIMDMYAFNKLDKNEIIYEFEHLNKRLNKISNNIRQVRQNTSLFGISALNSIPLFTVSIWVLVVSMLLSIG